MDTSLWELLRYDDWANRETIAALRTATTPHALKLLAHIVGSEWLWLGRLVHESQEVPVWPPWDLDTCAERQSKLPKAWYDFLEATPDLEATVRYENTKGEIWESRARDIVAHVVLHSAYHRGQIAQDTRGAGRKPPYTDYIHCMRQGFLD